MLITLECVLLALQAVAAVRIPLDSSTGIAGQSSNRLSKRSPVELGLGASRCFAIKSNVYGVDLNLLVDSSVSDIVVPLPSSSNDVGLAIQSIPGGQPVTINYKGDEYNGISSTTAVTIPGTRITGIDLPVLAVQKKSASLIGINPKFDGVFGFGHPSLSKHHSPITAINVLYNDGVISKNEVGLQLCPYEMLSDSFINIGNTDITEKCGTNGKSIAWVQSPPNSYSTVNIKSILVNGEKVDLPAGFQKKVEHGRTLYSSLETCSTYMHFPETVVAALISAILDNGAITVKSNLFDDQLSKEEIEKIFLKHYLMPTSNYNIKWDRMPTLSITMHAETPVTVENRNSVVTIKLGPRSYMQRYDSKRFEFAIEVGSDYYAALGIPFMNQLGLTFDRRHARIGFGPGCGCEAATDGYPSISTGYRVLWPLTQLSEQPSTSGSGGASTRRRKPTTAADQAVVSEDTHDTAKSHKQTLNKLD
ncbi:hypothetical protein BATDEDRAFT_90267 [Batrachochytrium dendrobatidis JAM81]|uniref:Peptidase A1 domain-containing protein n=2 Tax=Batrachochytrium dendrobatidis TaxID=109871 RepID=F4P6K9_BATDJ|nr:uncharacterized protein BATDEDRAFT_90267 [Batrachochytrium dendrobatidis JAM81]EGF78814.1 hypothetical protein BATDEDRAFT_90267 [Batrachochytrium dendrobatidis JAM81]OAJ45473.1 hypothetical protein BDEG_28612 [Batrachochytrium dendrobatidis JEL423]|eukprot:XP_006680463.1 hypothetical protein BATDEDRAFT_90267 [Batrachochytrium dendrobatidis JAM81]